MRYKIEKMEDISDTKSFINSYLSSCSYKFMKYSLYIIVVVLIAVVVGSMYIEKDIVVNAFGEIDTNNNMCNIYIENTSIGNIKENDDVIIEIVSLSRNEYGVINSTINKVSDDVIVDENSGKKYYTASCNLNSSVLTNKNGDKVELKNGMMSKVSIITYKTTYFNYMLESII